MPFTLRPFALFIALFLIGFSACATGGNSSRNPASTEETADFAKVDPCKNYLGWDSEKGTMSVLLDLFAPISGGFEPNTLRTRARCSTVAHTVDFPAPTARACLITGVSRKTGKSVIILNDLDQPGSGTNYFQEGEDPTKTGLYSFNAGGVLAVERAPMGDAIKYLLVRHLSFDNETGVLNFGVWSHSGEGKQMSKLKSTFRGYTLSCARAAPAN